MPSRSRSFLGFRSTIARGVAGTDLAPENVAATDPGPTTGIGGLGSGTVAGTGSARETEIATGTGTASGTETATGASGTGTSTGRETATAIAKAAAHVAAHYAVPEYSGLITALALPYSPPEIPRGPVYRFNLNHVLEPADPLDPFELELVDIRN